MTVSEFLALFYGFLNIFLKGLKILGEILKIISALFIFHIGFVSSRDKKRAQNYASTYIVIIIVPADFRTACHSHSVPGNDNIEIANLTHTE